MTAVKAQEPEYPDGWLCTPTMGFAQPSKLQACYAALRKIPRGTTLIQLTSFNVQRTNPANWVQLPRVWKDDDVAPQCVVEVYTRSRSVNDIFIPLTYDRLISMTLSLIDHCLLPSNQGGIRTYGLLHTVYMMQNRPVTYLGRLPFDPNRPDWMGGESRCLIASSHLALCFSRSCYLTASLSLSDPSKSGADIHQISLPTWSYLYQVIQH